MENLTKNFMDPNDAAVRKDFPGGWNNDTLNKFNPENLNSKEREAFDYFKKMANFRKSSLAIGKGTLKQFIPQNGVYVYFRIHKEQVLMCVLNTNDTDTDLKLDRFAEVLNGVSFLDDVLNIKKVQVASSINIPSMSFQLYELKNK
jgi:glycosidase